jgi:nucleotide-binding universal stress UspA family protein
MASVTRRPIRWRCAGESGYASKDVQWAKELLDEQVRRNEKSGAKVTKAYLREGEPDAEVVSPGEEIGAGMIVVGSRGLSPLRRPIRSVSSSIAAHCPVLVVRGVEAEG